MKTNNLTVTIVPPQHIQQIWDPIESLLQTIVDRAPNDVDIQTTYEEVLKGKQLLVVIMDENQLIVAVNVLDVRVTETGYTYLMIPLTAGTRMDEWIDDFMELAKNIAKDRDCKAIRGMAVRKGWLRALKQFKCRELYTTIEMPID